MWGLFRDNALRLRRLAGLGGISHFETALLIRRLANIDADLADELLSAAETGALRALNERDDLDAGEQD